MSLVFNLLQKENNLLYFQIVTAWTSRECLFQNFYFKRGHHQKKAQKGQKKLHQTLMTPKETERPKGCQKI